MKNFSFFCFVIFLFTVTITAQEQYDSSGDKEDYSRMGLNQNLQRDWSQFPLNSSSINSGIWTEVHPLIPRVDYWGVDFVNADTGWAVGEAGAIIKTTNGGEKWIWFESGVENTLRTVSSVNVQRVISAGDGGIIIISEDGGESWNTLLSGTTDNIWNMQMITEQIGWMVGEGGAVLKTTDGGLTWILQPMPYPNSPYWDLSFIDTSFGYVCSSSGIVLKTTNGGGDWQIQQAGDTRALWTICAIDTLRASGGGFAGKVVYTTDGGNNWLYAGGNPSGEINKIKFINDTTGFMAGAFYKTIDGGINWFPIYDLYEGGSTPLSTNLSFPGGTEGYVTGAPMLLAKTTDNGESWRRTIVNADFINVYFKDEQNGFMNSSHLIYKTNDGGYTIDTLETFPYNEIFSMEAMTFTDNLTGYIGSTSLSIYKTTNSGISWYSTNISGINDTIGTISKIFFPNYVLGWATSYDGKIFKTTDSGENWFLQYDGGINVIFHSIYFIDSLVGWTANSNRRPYKTTNGGSTWIEQINLNLYTTRDIYFNNDTIGFCTENNKLYRTLNGGLSWNLDPLVIGFGLGRFGYLDSINIFITGKKVYRTTDGGDNWTEFPELEGQDWRLTIILLNVNSGYLVGNTGLIVKYYDDTVPVELISFRATIDGNLVFLNWITATEINNKGFSIERKKVKENNWTEIAFLNGAGTSTEKNFYNFSDQLYEKGRYFYRLKQIDYDGEYEYSEQVGVEYLQLDGFHLFQNFPNPFNSSTVINYQIPEDEFVMLKIYDVLGKEVTTLVKERKAAGYYTIEFQADDLSTGIYLYKLTAGKHNATRKLTLLK